MENKFRIIEQSEKINNVVIAGVEEQNICPTEIVEKIFRCMNMNYEKDAIKECRRISNKKNAPILVKFKGKAEKLALYKRRKEIRSIKCVDCGLPGNKTIYFRFDTRISNTIEKGKGFKTNEKLQICLQHWGKDLFS